MPKHHLLFALIAIVFSGHEPALSQFPIPKPEVFARKEDQQRAQLLTKACVEADVGRGCNRSNGALMRDYPCTSLKSDIVVGLPTDQCYRMDEPRRYRGVWIDEFEGQQFIPEGTRPPKWPDGNSRTPGWRKRLEQARLASIWLDTSRATFAKKPRVGGRKWIEFVGRKTRYPGLYGHLGMSGHEIIVDRVIALRECPPKGGCR
jgi:hypothetical protein